jgi:hypothetical protein
MLAVPPVTMPVMHVVDVVAVLDRFVTASFSVLVIAVVLVVAAALLLSSNGVGNALGSSTSVAGCSIDDPPDE